MTREEAKDYIREWCPYDRQEEIIKALEQQHCDKCVYSTNEGCQYDDITEAIPPVETSDDAISRQAVLKIIDGWYEQNRDTDNIEDLIVLITYMDSVNPQKPFDDNILTLTETLTKRVVTQVTEDMDNFIFTTIKPWCEAKEQREISKRDLEQALTQYFSLREVDDGK